MKIKPSKQEFQCAREISKEALNKASSTLQKKSETNIDLVWTEEPHFIQNMGGARGMPFGHKIIRIDFNTQPKGWKDKLKVAVAHEYAHLWHSEKTDKSNTHRWAYFIEEGLTQNFAELLYPDIAQGHRTKHSIEDMKKYWPRVRELIQGPRLATWDPIFFGNEEFPKWLGYSMSYQIGQKLMKDHNLREFPELEKGDVIKAGDSIFG